MPAFRYRGDIIEDVVEGDKDYSYTEIMEFIEGDSISDEEELLRRGNRMEDNR